MLPLRLAGEAFFLYGTGGCADDGRLRSADDDGVDQPDARASVDLLFEGFALAEELRPQYAGLDPDVKNVLFEPQFGGQCRGLCADDLPPCVGEFSFGDFLVRIGRGKGENALYFDADKLPQNCLFRTRKEGDVFQKFGASPKKLKDFLIDRKIPCRLRDRLPVLACGSEVYAVCGAEISEKIRVDATSKNIFHILLIKKGEEHSCIRT